MKYEVIDNFLSEEKWKELNDVLFFPNGDGRLLMSYVAGVNEASKANQFAFCRVFIDQNNLSFMGAEPLIDIIMQPLCAHIKSHVSIYRGKVNLFTRTPTNEGLGMHHDLDTEDYQTIIYYLNDNNGGTRFADGTFIEQKRNRALIIDGKVLHESVTQTDTNIRVNININYYLQK